MIRNYFTGGDSEMSLKGGSGIDRAFLVEVISKQRCRGGKLEGGSSKSQSLLLGHSMRYTRITVEVQAGFLRILKC